MLGRLRRQLTVLAALLTGGVVLAVAAAAFWLTGRLYTAQRQASFEAVVSDLSGQWLRTGTLDLEQLRQTAQRSGIGLYFEENGAPLRLSGLAGTAGTGSELCAQLDRQGFDCKASPSQSESILLPHATADGQAVRAAARKQPTENGWHLLVVWQPLAAERRTLALAGAGFGCVALAGIALVTAVCWVVAGRAIRPVKQAMQGQKDFVRAAGHELRTPLGVLRAGLAVLEKEDAAAARRHIGLLDAEAARMGRLIDQLLILSGGGMVQSSRPQLLEPDTLLLDTAEAWEPAARQAGRPLRCDLPPCALPAVTVCREELCQILAIFLDNALRYAPPGTAVELRCRAETGRIVWTVADHGPGIPPPVREKVFRRFWRAEESRADRRHFGLGLSVAAELAARCGLALGVDETPGGGASFWVSAKL